MRVGVIGAGNMGAALAAHLARLGHDVVIANSRGPGSLVGLAAQLGDGVRADTVADAARPGAPEAERLAIPIAADDTEAKELVAGLVRSIGFAPVDGGSLADGRRQEPGTPVYGAEVTPGEARAALSER